MEFTFSENRFKKILSQKDIFLKLLAGSLVLNGLQLIERMCVVDKIVMVPPALNQEVWVMGGVQSQSFIEEWALYLSSLLLNVTSHTADFQHKSILKYVHPSSVSKVQKKLNDNLKHMKDNAIATVFKPKSVEILKEGDILHAKILGTLSTFVGIKIIEEKDRVFDLTFKTSKTMPQLSLVSFEEETKEMLDLKKQEGDVQ